jgi:hypothetical protein
VEAPGKAGAASEDAAAMAIHPPNEEERKGENPDSENVDAGQPSEMEEGKHTLDPSLRVYEPWIREVSNRHLCEEIRAGLDDMHATINDINIALAANHQRLTYGHVPRTAQEAFVLAVKPALQVIVGHCRRASRTCSPTPSNACS